MIWKPSAGLPHIKIVASLVLLLFFIRLRGGWARCIFLPMISSRLGRVLINAQIASLHGAGRPVLLWRWRGLPASAAIGRCFHSYRASSVPRSGLGSCDSRHGLLFEYPIIFWTNQRSVT